MREERKGKVIRLSVVNLRGTGIQKTWVAEHCRLRCLCSQSKLLLTRKKKVIFSFSTSQVSLHNQPTMDNVAGEKRPAETAAEETSTEVRLPQVYSRNNSNTHGFSIDLLCHLGVVHHSLVLTGTGFIVVVV